MRKGLFSVLSSGVIVLALGIGTSTATATTAPTWTISPGGAVTGTAGTTVVTDTTTGAQVMCTSSSVAAMLKSGTGLQNPLGKVTGVAYNSCTFSGAGFNITSFASTTSPWLLRGGIYRNAAHGRIGHIQGTFSGPFGCSGTFAGASATTLGTVYWTYHNSTGVLTTFGGNVHAWNVVGNCFGNIASGDALMIAGQYAISPGQTITSP